MMTKDIYNGKYVLEFNENNHRYKINGDYKLGVTTILRRLDKGEGLMQWAVNIALDAFENGASKADAKKAHLSFRDATADIGKSAHEWISHFLKTNVKLSIAPEIAPCVEAFNKWWKETEPFDIQSERAVYSEKYDYCGTCDIIFKTKFGGRTLRVVADFKTGSPEKEYVKRKTFTGYTSRVRPYAEAFYQCGLYDQAIYEEDGVWADAYMVIYLTKTGELYTFISDQPEIYRDAGLCTVHLMKAEKSLKDIHVYRD